MRVGQLLTSVSRRRSGIFEFASGLSRAVAQSGAESLVFGIRDPDSESDAHRWLPVRPVIARRLGPRRIGFAPGLLPALLRAKLDLLHAHDLWTAQCLLTLAWAARAGRPYVVSINGMLNPRALQRSRLKKRVAAALYENRRLSGAACLHSLGPHETAFVRRFGLKSPVAELPYGVDTPPPPEPLPPPAWSGHLENGRPVLLYLGRLDPIKGLDNLVRGWARARKAAPRAAEPWRLVLAGWGEDGYASVLEELVRAECPDRSILFPGPLFGLQREAAYRSAQACVLPSLSEGQPVGVLEAFARCRPVLMTETCHLPEGFASGAAVRMAPGPAGAASALLELFAMSGADREAMGRRGRRLIDTRFAWPVVGRQFLDVYRWAAGEGVRPDCVRMA
jgi:poly(glycerol-phosphate) alpha-glucosyltransferase